MSRKIEKDTVDVSEEIEKLKDGEPIPISQLKLKRRRGLSLEVFSELCRSIPEGYAQAIRGIPGSTARDRIRKLIQEGILPNSYRVTITGKGENARVYIIHEKEVKK
ncbi:MAG: hypothetical protein QXV01_10640 [Candidatus Bathyarchaeia archaeon]|nr:hypothetical protein [Candidatus Bathyarchaeota archaeon]